MSRSWRPDLDSPRWRALRLVIFDRDGWRCRTCGRAGRLECDHVVPLHAGGKPWDQANLQTLCRDCHREKSRTEQQTPDPPDVAAWRVYMADNP